MTEETREGDRQKRSMATLAMVNVGIWAIAIVAMMFLMQDAPIVKRLFPILAGGTGVGIALISVISKMK